MIMKSERVNKPEIKVAGLSVRTNNEQEMNPATSKIGELVGRFHQEQLAKAIPHRARPGVSLSIYTDYESDETGSYTYFIGEEVSSFEGLAADIKQLIIPAAVYQKFTTEPGVMPQVIIQAWQQIWQMSPQQLGAPRAFQADFEVYDERARNPQQAVADIYIGIKA